MLTGEVDKRIAFPLAHIVCCGWGHTIGLLSSNSRFRKWTEISQPSLKPQDIEAGNGA